MAFDDLVADDLANAWHGLNHLTILYNTACLAEFSRTVRLPMLGQHILSKLVAHAGEVLHV